MSAHCGFPPSRRVSPAVLFFACCLGWFSGCSVASAGPHAKRGAFFRGFCPLPVAHFDALSVRGAPAEVVLYMFLETVVLKDT